MTLNIYAAHLEGMNPVNWCISAEFKLSSCLTCAFQLSIHPLWKQVPQCVHTSPTPPLLIFPEHSSMTNLALEREEQVASVKFSGKDIGYLKAATHYLK